MKKNILIIDDDKRLRELLKDYLNENNLEVYQCEDFLEAKEILSFILFDLIILDRMMPSGDGIDLIEFLKLCAANHDEQIYINSPYVSQPAVNLKPLDQRINKIEVYPVGDSLFTGNPKVGNGLMNHLSRIAKLVRTIENAI